MIATRISNPATRPGVSPGRFSYNVPPARGNACNLPMSLSDPVHMGAISAELDQHFRCAGLKVVCPISEIFLRSQIESTL